MRRLEGIQRHIQAENKVGGLRRLEMKLQNEMSEILEQEELLWFQRSRAKWLIDGDHNTKYYYIKIMQHKRRNTIVMIKYDEGQWVDEKFS